MTSLKSKMVAGVAVGAMLVASVFAATALAASHNPKGEFAQFKECPLNTVTITDCIFSVSNGGGFTVGKKTVPLVNPVTLQAGAEGSGEEVTVYGAENGDTLSKTPQPVPGIGTAELDVCPAALEGAAGSLPPSAPQSNSDGHFPYRYSGGMLV